MRKYFMWALCLFLVTISSQAFCGEMKVIKYSESALNRALSDNLPVALWFTDDDDYECQKLEQDMLSNGQFVAATEDLIWLKVDMTGPANRAIHNNLLYDYNVTKLPSIIYLNSDGREYKNTRTSGYTNSDNILTALIAGAVIGWLLSENWHDDYYYNNHIVYRDNSWWRNNRDWIIINDRYYHNDRYRHYRYPNIILPSRRPNEPFPDHPGYHPFPPDKRDVRSDFPPVVGPRQNVPKPNIAKPNPNIARPNPNIAKPGPNVRPDIRRDNPFPPAVGPKPQRPDISKPAPRNGSSFPPARPSITDKRPAQNQRPSVKESAPRPAPGEMPERMK